MYSLGDSGDVQRLEVKGQVKTPELLGNVAIRMGKPIYRVDGGVR
jgi:hypothetical protein